jgi:hypothetical protein
METLMNLEEEMKNYKGLTQFDHGCLLIRQELRDLRDAGFNSAHALSDILNGLGIPLPAIATWTPADVLKVVRTLKKLGVDEGTLRANGWSYIRDESYCNCSRNMSDGS